MKERQYILKTLPEGSIGILISIIIVCGYYFCRILQLPQYHTDDFYIFYLIEKNVYSVASPSNRTILIALCNTYSIFWNDGSCSFYFNG